jgi:hypothetical protein
LCLAEYSQTTHDNAVARRLFTVESTFVIEGRGLVPVPGIVPIDDECFRIGDPITLVRPDGTKINTSIAGLEMLDPNPHRDVVVLIRGLLKVDVPPGTEVWSVDNAEHPSTQTTANRLNGE